MRVVALLVLVACGRVGFEAPGRDASLDGDAPLVCPASYTGMAPGRASRYRAMPFATWGASQQACESDGTHLIVLDDPVELAWAAQEIGVPQWLGLSDHATEGTFLAVNGRTSPFLTWTPQNPNDSFGDEDCVELFDGAFNDVGCTGLTRNFLCECDGLAPATPTWCNTHQESDCGECGNSCDAGDVCANQVCTDPS